jgi:hypothetical protein
MFEPVDIKNFALENTGVSGIAGVGERTIGF